MALLHSWEESGKWLFKYRGQLPIILFAMAVPAIKFNSYVWINDQLYLLITILAVVTSFLGLIIRSITIGITPKGTSGRNTKEQVAEQLNTKGIYSTLRHPLYLGNFLMWLGIVIFSFNLWFFFSFCLLYWLYYERIMFAEERFLERKFGQTYIDWSLKIPAFIPSFKHYEKTEMNFSLKAVLRREYSGILATLIAFDFVIFIRQYFHPGSFNFSQELLLKINIPIILLVAILKLLKKFTSLLSDSHRS
jgi:protein-S-isoprenylcysteine O-methyltransferase Ste14